MLPTIIYILGAGNSGSTLLSMALGGHPQIASVGELANLDRWHASGRACSCGATLPQCEVWGPIMENVEPERPPVPIAPGPKAEHLITSNAKCFASDVHMPYTISRNVALYSQIKETFGCEAIVDASKNPLHFYYLYRSGYFRIVPILLVRKGEEYLESSLRRGRSTSRSILRWIKLNMYSRRVLREVRLSESIVHVRYRDLVVNPENTLARICKASSLPYEPEMLAFYKKNHHNVAGTRTRFNARPIENTGSKKNALSPHHRLIFRMCGGDVWNRFFGA